MATGISRQQLRRPAIGKLFHTKPFKTVKRGGESVRHVDFAQKIVVKDDFFFWRDQHKCFVDFVPNGNLHAVFLDLCVLG